MLRKRNYTVERSGTVFTKLMSDELFNDIQVKLDQQKECAESINAWSSVLINDFKNYGVDSNKNMSTIIVTMDNLKDYSDEIFDYIYKIIEKKEFYEEDVEPLQKFGKYLSGLIIVIKKILKTIRSSKKTNEMIKEINHLLTDMREYGIFLDEIIRRKNLYIR